MFYQVGGSLKSDAPCYVERECDRDLYEVLKRGEFCYVLNCRQMGKSSLMVRVRQQLQREGYKCATLDLTLLGGQNITPRQWYKGIISELIRGLKLFNDFNLKTWWNDSEDISFVQILGRFFGRLLSDELADHNIVIFIDEIDSILSLNFSADDFFALIRFCFNQRATDPKFNRLTFALFGVATPSDLIQDKNRTPFNIGTAIALSGFSLEEVEPLARGLDTESGNEKEIIKEILVWTSGQPFLTQKLCQIIGDNYRKNEFGYQLKIPPGLEVEKVEQIVRNRVIDEWQAKDEPEHLKTIRDRLFRNPRWTGRLLGIYQQVLQHQSVAVDDSREQAELLLSGLVVKRNGKLWLKNRIYGEVFNPEWVVRQLSELRPYSQAFDAWIISGQQDESRLLRGRALKDAQAWAMGKSLSDVDYQFLSHSETLDRREVQMALEAARTQEVEARLAAEHKRLQQEKKVAKLQRLFLAVVSLAFAVSAGMGIFARWQFRQARLSEILALASSSQSLLASDNQLNSTIDAIKARRGKDSLLWVDPSVTERVETALKQAIYGSHEFNRLLGHQAGILDVTFSSDGQLLASASSDSSVKLWHPDGRLWKDLKGHKAMIFSVDFSPDNSMLVSGSEDSTVKLWSRDGILLNTFRGHQSGVMGVAFSPDGQTVASASLDGTVKLWNLDGTLLKTFRFHRGAVMAIAFSPDGQTVASGSADNTIKLWNLDGTLLQTFRGHGAAVMGVAFSPDGQTVASGSADNTIKLWNLQGNLRQTLGGHRATVWRVKFSADGETIGSASWDKTIKIWSRNGSLLETLRGHEATVWTMAFSPDGSTVASGAGDNMVKLWKTKNPFVNRLSEHATSVWTVAFSPDGSLLASGGWDKTVKLWNREGTLLHTLSGDQSAILRVAFSPDSQTLVSSNANGILQLWSREGTLLKTLAAHRAMIFGLAFSPDGEIFVSASLDKTIKIWKADGTLLKTLNSESSAAWFVAISPDSQTIASGHTDGTVRLWNRRGTLLKTIESHPTMVSIVAFSRDGETLAVGSSNSVIKLWKLDGTLLKMLREHRAQIWGIVFSPDGQTFATASADRTIKLWSSDGTLLADLQGHSSTIREISFSPDGQTIASANDDNTVILWNLEQVQSLKPLEYACDWVRDYLRHSAEVKAGDRNLCKNVGN